MLRPQRRAAAFLAIAMPGSALADNPTLPIVTGLYEIVVNLDLPHLEGMGASRTTTVCISAASNAATHGLVVLSENNPLGACPASKVRLEANTYRFEVHCAGKNAAEGYATYQLLPDSFQGSITMKMGGKNMTMTETQKGRRVGNCPEPPRS